MWLKSNNVLMIDYNQINRTHVVKIAFKLFILDKTSCSVSMDIVTIHHEAEEYIDILKNCLEGEMYKYDQ